MEDLLMVRVGDNILVNGKIKAKITELFLLADGRWYIGYRRSNGKMDFFLEGDEVFRVIVRRGDDY
jgi:hypothetical protein